MQYSSRLWLPEPAFVVPNDVGIVDLDDIDPTASCEASVDDDDDVVDFFFFLSPFFLEVGRFRALFSCTLAVDGFWDAFALFLVRDVPGILQCIGSSTALCKKELWVVVVVVVVV